eukprot:810765-Alexandrium_andersonii.AAC.1
MSAWVAARLPRALGRPGGLQEERRVAPRSSRELEDLSVVEESVDKLWRALESSAELGSFLVSLGELGAWRWSSS